LFSSHSNFLLFAKLTGIRSASALEDAPSKAKEKEQHLTDPNRPLEQSEHRASLRLGIARTQIGKH
jgi:hypothetical protein